jgi:hypothetical protein
MLSLIVCSVNPALLETMKQSAAATVGVEHEWLVFDNRTTNLGICEVYNQMAARATFRFLVFLHEDLVFKTNNWGGCLLDIFNNDDSVGLIGIAGSDYKSRYLSGWYSGGSGRDYFNITHRLNGTDKHLFFPQGWESGEAEVACVDGVFMACPRSVWELVEFDQHLLKKFHFYDIDFSLRVAGFRKVLVTNRIDLVHLTIGGDFGDKWVEQAFVFHQEHGNELPFQLEKKVHRNDHPLIEYWLDWLKDQSISFANRLKWVHIQKLYFKPGLWYGILKFLFYRPLGLKRIHTRSNEERYYE